MDRLLSELDPIADAQRRETLHRGVGLRSHGVESVGGGAQIVKRCLARFEGEASEPSNDGLLVALGFAIPHEKADPERIVQCHVSHPCGQSADALEVTAVERGSEQGIGNTAMTARHEHMFA